MPEYTRVLNIRTLSKYDALKGLIWFNVKVYHNLLSNTLFLNLLVLHQEATVNNRARTFSLFSALSDHLFLYWTSLTECSLTCKSGGVGWRILICLINCPINRFAVFVYENLFSLNSVVERAGAISHLFRYDRWTLGNFEESQHFTVWLTTKIFLLLFFIINISYLKNW